MRWAGHVARMEEGRSAFKSSTDKPTGNSTSGRPRHRKEGNIRMDHEEIGRLSMRGIGIIGEPLLMRH